MADTLNPLAPKVGQALMLHRDDHIYRIVSLTDAPHGCVRIRRLDNILSRGPYYTEVVRWDQVDGHAPQFDARVVG